MIGKALKDRIIILLDEHPLETFTSKQLAALLSANRKSVRVKIAYLVNKGKINKITKGLYQSIRGIVREEFDLLIRFHALKIEARCSTWKGWSYPALFDIVTRRFANPRMCRHAQNKGITTYSDWELRQLTITLHKEELEIFCNSSNHPLNLLDITNYFSYIDGAFGLPEAAWTVTQCDYNIDEVGKINMPIGSISVSNFKDMILKFYEKKIGLVRTELRSFEKISAERLIKNAEIILKTMEGLKSER